MAIGRHTPIGAQKTVEDENRDLSFSESAEIGSFQDEAALDPAAQSGLMLAMAQATADAHEQVFALKADLARAREIVLAENDAEISALRDRIAELEGERQRTEIDVLRARAEQVEGERARAEHFEAWTNALLSSTSWRITGPLRWIVRILRGY